jgi:ribosomal protein S18 acetylase RimI-like enzyme
VALEWKHSIDGVDWKELSALYRAAQAYICDIAVLPSHQGIGLGKQI